MDQLTFYLLNNYGNLMTMREYAAKTTAMAVIILARDAETARPPEQRTQIEEKFVSKDAEVLAMLADGPEKCLQHIRERILQDHPAEVFLNYCPRCQKLARTP